MVRWCCVNFKCRGILLIWIRVGQGPTALAVGAVGGCLDILLSSSMSFFFLILEGLGLKKSTKSHKSWLKILGDTPYLP